MNANKRERIRLQRHRLRCIAGKPVVVSMPRTRQALSTIRGRSTELQLRRQ